MGIVNWTDAQVKLYLYWMDGPAAFIAVLFFLPGGGGGG